LLIYRDDPCVVIGRNQNPWKEVNLTALNARKGTPLIRRRSGGGTVYHDLGNTNFSIHLPRSSFDRHVTAQVVLRAVQSLGVDARINDRNDICVGVDKVSGSAYKIVNKRAYHHGTMLISTRLDTLGDLLKTNKDTMVSRGVASVPSPVCNLQHFSSTVTHEAFTNAVIQAFRDEYGVQEEAYFIESDSDDLEKNEYIQRGISELTSWDWVYGQTPEFTYTVQNSFTWGNITAEIRCKHGVILACSIHVSDAVHPSIESELSTVGQAIEGKKYGFLGEEPITRGKGPMLDVASWLTEIMQT